MKQVLEVLKRRKWLFIIPFCIAFVLPSVFSFIFMREYKANALLWLDDDLSISAVLEGKSPADVIPSTIEGESRRFEQLLKSRTFVIKVIEKTPLKADLSTPKKREKAIKYIQRNLGLYAVGPNALEVAFHGKDGEEAVLFAQVASDVFIEWVREAVQTQNEESTTFFAESTEGYRTELNRIRIELQKFKEDHPETQQLVLAEKTFSTQPITVSPFVQGEFQRLTMEEQSAQELYAGALEDLAKNRAINAAQTKKYMSGLRIVDEPVEPLSFSKTKMVLYWFLSFVAALVLGICVVVIAEFTDRSLHTASDVGQLLDLAVLTEVRDAADKRTL
ncbi:MAG: hypothetical protein FWE94_05310 [Coriobacteriia bacterium]|nr:hypothetical protein [Coriobacteriia bacterium]